MVFEVQKHERETNLALVRRFSKRIKDSGVIRGAKKKLFTKRPLSVAKKKMNALRRIAKLIEKEKLAKLGNIVNI